MQEGQVSDRVTSDSTIASISKNTSHLDETERNFFNADGRTISPVNNDILFSLESKTVLSDEDRSLNELPYSVRKDLLVRELESGLAESQDGHVDSTSEFEEEKSDVEMDRNSVLIEIDGTISEIQHHVKNAKELEKEKRATEEECSELRNQVKHLTQLLESQNGRNLDFKDQNENHDYKSIANLLEEANGRNRALEKQINQLRTENEELIIQIEATDAGFLPNGMDKKEIEALRMENEHLQKLLEMSEESEDNLSHELKECEKALRQMQTRNKKLESRTTEFNSYKQQWEEERDSLEEELDRLKIELEKVRGRAKDNNQTVPNQDSTDGTKNNKSECNLALDNDTTKNTLLAEELVAKNKRIESLESEIKKYKKQRDIDSEETSDLINKGVQATQQLRAALEKLNKENATLQDSLEKTEKEANTFKAALEAEKAAKDKIKAGAVEKVKPKSKTKKAETTEGNSLDTESRLEALSQEKDSLKSECKALSETVAKVVNEKRAMDVELGKLKEDKENLTSVVSELKVSVQDLDKIKTDKMKLEEAYIKLRGLHDDLEEKQTSTNEAYRGAKDNLELAIKEKGDLEKQATNLEETVKSLQNNISELKHTITTKNSELSTLTRTFEEKSKKLSVSLENKQTENKRLVEQNKVHMSNLKKTEEVKKYLADANQSWEPQIKSLRVALDAMKVELQNTRTRNDELELALKNSEERAKKAEEMVQNLKSSSARSSDIAMEKSLELSKTKRTLEKKIEKLTKENMEIKKKMKGVSNDVNLFESERLSPVCTENVSEIPPNLPPSVPERVAQRSLDTSSLPTTASESVVYPARQKRRSIDEQLLRTQRKEFYATLSDKESGQSTTTSPPRKNSSGSLPEIHSFGKVNGPIDNARKPPERVQVIAREEWPMVVSRSHTGSPTEWATNNREVIQAIPLVTKDCQEDTRGGANERVWGRTQNNQNSRKSSHFVNSVEPVKIGRSYQQLPESKWPRRDEDAPREHYSDKPSDKINDHSRPHSGMQYYAASIQQPSRPPSYDEVRKNVEVHDISQHRRGEASSERILPSYQDATRSKLKGNEERTSPFSLDQGHAQRQSSPKLLGQNKEWISANPVGKYQGRTSPNPIETYKGRISPNPSGQNQGRKSPLPTGRYQEKAQPGFRAQYNRVMAELKPSGNPNSQPEPVTARVKYEPDPVMSEHYNRTYRRSNSPQPQVSLQTMDVPDRRSRESPDIEETRDEYIQPNEIAANEHWV